MNYPSAQGLASLGRNGDSMLVHMNPSEVAGLQSLAMAQGGSLTINPQTGLPEAFSLGGFFKGLLPMFAGMATGGAGMPLWAGIAAGAATGAITSKDKLMGALTGGLGGYGGYNLGQGFAAAAAPTTPTTATSGYVNPMTAVNATDVVKQGIANPLSGMNAGLQTQNLYPTNLLNQANASGFASSAATGATGIDKSFLGGLNNLGPGVQNVGSGMKNVFTGQPGAFDAFKASFVEPGAKPISDLAAYGKIAMPVGGAALGGLEPSDIYGEPINMASAKSKEAYDPYATLNLGGSSGLRLVAKGGYIDGYAVGGAIDNNASSSAGISDLYNRPEGQTMENLSQDGYGIGRLNNLANAEAMNTARVTGYAVGGPISFADGGDTDMKPLGITSLAPDANVVPNLESSNKMSDAQLINTMKALIPFKGGNFSYNIARDSNQLPSTDDSIVSKVAANLKADPNYRPANPIEEAIVNQLKGTNQSTEMQRGLGSLSAAPSQPMAPSYSPSVAMSPTYYAGMNAPRGYADGGETSLNLDKLPSLNINTGEARVLNDGSSGIGDKVLRQMFSKGNPSYSEKEYSTFYNAPVTDQTGKNIGMNTGQLADKLFAGMKFNFAHGGYLDGHGDGMSDSIPATIEGKQPARLADGEFVVSADVVSHLGNGSTKAGAKKLYKMMDKVRLARTGTKKQGKQINPETYLPK